MILERKKNQSHQRYYINGKQLPGASSIASYASTPRAVKALQNWHFELGEKGIDYKRHLDDLADSGTLAHYLIECDLVGFERDPEYLAEFTKNQIDRAETALIKYYEWRDHYEVKPILHEKQFVSLEYRFGGTLDIFADVREIHTTQWLHTLIDIKTCKAIYGNDDSKWAQLGGYDILALENGLAVDECRILRAGRSEEEGFEYALSRRREDQRKRFIKCRELYEINSALSRRAA